MMKLLILKDGKREVVSRDRHFTDLLREYMGNDAAEYYEERVGDLIETVDEVKEMLEALDSLEDIAETVRDILKEVEYE